METNQVAPVWKSPYVLGVAAIALILLLAVLIPGCWNSTPPDGAADDRDSIVTATTPSSDDQDDDQITTDNSSSADTPSVTQRDSALVVSVAPHLFEESEGEGGDSAPYSDESFADEFAIGVVRKVAQRGGTTFLPLELNEVFLGRLPSGRFLAEDKMVVRMECSLPPRNLNESEMLDEILEHGLRQKPGRRGTYISELRIQSDYADADARRRLAEGLQKFMDDSPSLDSLAPVKDRDVWGDVANAKQALDHLKTREAQRQNPK